MVGMALPEGGSVNGSIYAAPGSIEGLGAHLLVHQCTRYKKQTGQIGSAGPFPELYHCY